MMFTVIAKKICRVCESGDGSVNNILFMTTYGEIMLLPERLYQHLCNERNIWIATFNTGEGFVGAGIISENEPWVRILTEECIEKMRRKKIIVG